MTKMTNKMALEIAIASVDNAEAKAKLEKMLAQVVKKNSAEKKPTKVQLENETIKTAILDFMVEGDTYTITELMERCEAVAGMTNQKVTSLIRQLKDSGLVERTEVKRKARFGKVVADASAEYLPREVEV